MALLIRPDRIAQEVKPVNGKKFTLQEMYALIGCTCVTRVKVDVRGPASFRGKDGTIEYELTRRMWIWVDDEGLLKIDPQFNPVASDISGFHDLFGNALITGTGEA